MVDIVARLKLKGKTFEIMVDCDSAEALKKQKNVSASSIRDVLATDIIFSDFKKGLKFSTDELKEAFGTEDTCEIGARILEDGELLLPMEYREKKREAKFKQIVDFLVKNCLDPRTSAPYTAERISSAMKQAGAKIDENHSADEQALLIVKDLAKIMPIKIETKKIKLIIPPEHVGKIYSLLRAFTREKEEWLSNGSLSCIINLPAGMQIEFYDKLNAVTHGSALTEEIKG